MLRFVQSELRCEGREGAGRCDQLPAFRFRAIADGTPGAEIEYLYCFKHATKHADLIGECNRKIAKYGGIDQ